MLGGVGGKLVALEGRLSLQIAALQGNLFVTMAGFTLTVGASLLLA